MSARVLALVCKQLRASDILVFERADEELRVIGGCGRGAGWAGIVATRLADEPHASAAMGGHAVRIDAGGPPERIIGPYWAAAAMLVPVGDAHLVVFGGDDLARVSDGELLRHAATAAGACGGISTDKLLADELELVHAVRDLMSSHAASVPETMRHVAQVAADALSCDIGAVLLRREGAEPMLVVAGDAACQCPDDSTLMAALMPLVDRARLEPVVEQDVGADRQLPGIELVSRLTLNIGGDATEGILFVGHSRSHPRGFTSLCQRIGRSIADAAQVLIAGSIVRETLATERDRYATAARTDALTGLGNRIAWNDALAGADDETSHFAIVIADVRGLKRTNDEHGLAAGDALLLGAAALLRDAVRDSDVVARIGGDEFGVLMHDANPALVERVVARVATVATVGMDRSRPGFAVGWALQRPGEPLAGVLAGADDVLRADKQPHARAAPNQERLAG